MRIVRWKYFADEVAAITAAANGPADKPAVNGRWKWVTSLCRWKAEVNYDWTATKMSSIRLKCEKDDWASYAGRCTLLMLSYTPREH